MSEETGPKSKKIQSAQDLRIKQAMGDSDGAVEGVKAMAIAMAEANKIYLDSTRSTGKKPDADKTVPGGCYFKNGVYVNANGQVIATDSDGNPLGIDGNPLDPKGEVSASLVSNAMPPAIDNVNRQSI
jgi:hypothetical protein